MRKSILSLLLLVFTCNMTAQNPIQITDIDLKNLGDGQYYGHKLDDNKTPLEGKTRIITGYTTEYIDANFKKGLAVGKWEYYKNNKLSA